MKIVAVTSCPTSAANTYVAAERLEKIAKSLGHQIKIETQGATGIENELCASDISQADFVIFAVDFTFTQFERFAGRRQLHASVEDAIRNPKEIFATLL